MGSECPRCGQKTMKAPIEQNAITVEDKKTYICSKCGHSENKIILYKAKNKLIRIEESELELSKKFREKLGLD